MSKTGSIPESVKAQYRFNRRFDLKIILRRLIRAAATTGKRPEVWLRLAEAQR